MPEYNFIVIDSDSKSGVRQNSREALNSVGILPASHRVQIADLVSQQQQVMAEEVYKQFNAQRRFVSRAIAYNTLKLLADYGLLRQVTLDRSRGFYDSNISPHHHFFDSYAGKLKDIEAEQFGMPEPPSGKSVAGVDVVVRLKSTG